MAFAKISPASALSLTLVKDHGTPADLKSARASIFQDAKARFGIPLNVKIKVEIRDRNNPDYCVIKTKGDVKFELADDGLWVNAARNAAPVAAPAPKMGWFKLEKDALQELVVDTMTASEAVDLPDGTSYVATGVSVGNGAVFVQVALDAL
jgi:hypothetical protein